ncbi:50S ribosomal protein L32 [Nocardiopsis sp. CNR-923]|uniref:50S ribosomal protein L32 n=1 Tax=Nocardiopsis sp. CNR-923 TaxID=1904965 RepID=UPI00096A3E22|nr:50S ribosomal protein L32 [Nocardiopsis sp. CNR-923]
MAVPQRKTSRANTRTRRAQWRAAKPELVPVTIAAVTTSSPATSCGPTGAACCPPPGRRPRPRDGPPTRPAPAAGLRPTHRATSGAPGARIETPTAKRPATWSANHHRSGTLGA